MGRVHEPEENIESLTEQKRCEIIVLKDMLRRAEVFLGKRDQFNTTGPTPEEIEEFLEQVRAVLSGRNTEHG
jgi:hypothetical protein